MSSQFPHAGWQRVRHVPSGKAAPLLSMMTSGKRVKTLVIRM
jgi:hypothetical protein